MGLTIWALPERAELETLVDELAGVMGTPAFTPHVTLVSAEAKEGVDKLRQAMDIVCAELASGPLDCRIHGLQTGPDFFQSLLLALHNSPELARLQYTLLEQLYGTDGATKWVGPNGPKWFPHISLAYSPGLLYQLRQEKLAIATSVSRLGVAEKDVLEAIEDEPRARNVPLRDARCKISKIVLVDCDCSSPEAIATWKVLYERNL